MAFQTATLRPSLTTSLRQRGTLTGRRVGGRVSVSPMAATIWQLQVDPKWSQSNQEDAKLLCETIDLTAEIGTKEFCSVGTNVDHSHDSDQVFEAVGGGVHVKFEAEGTSNPLDSPSVLKITDIDSEVDIKVDGEKLEKETPTKLRPGAILQFGDHAVYDVQRNVIAHA